MKKILVIDDDPDMSEFVVQLLSAHSFDVLSAKDGREGCARAAEFRPDLVILDLMMPDMHGFEVCQVLRKDERFRGLKIVISSGKKYDADRKAAQQLGADVFLPKPYSVDQLLGVIQSLLGTA
jgi:DNA-binding response OmpR family regulator